jgi:hypothetical protein
MHIAACVFGYASGVFFQLWNDISGGQLTTVLPVPQESFLSSGMVSDGQLMTGC